VETRSMESLLIVFVVAVAGFGALALVHGALGLLILRSDFSIHALETIKATDIRPIN